MEYVEGRNLEEELAVRGGPLPEGLVIDIARQLCDVLAYLHGSTPPIVYRDMKPSNVMLTPKGRVVLVDFGIARLFKAARKGTMIGTLGFAPPEQYQGVVDPRSDIYSLGATLHYVLTGRDPEKFPPFSFPADARSAPGGLEQPGGRDRSRALLPGRRAARDASRISATCCCTARASTTPRSAGGSARTAAPPASRCRPMSPRRSRRRIVRRRSASVAPSALVAFFAMLAGGAFGATYVYNNPQLQQRLGVKSFIDSLPWKHRGTAGQGARDHPLDFQRMTLQLSTRSGTPLSSPQASFTNIELANNQYLQWNASFNNRLAGLEGTGREDRGALLRSPRACKSPPATASRFVGTGARTTVDFSGVALMPDLRRLAGGQLQGRALRQRPG